MHQLFATAQKDCVDSLFSQNSFISYDALHKLGIPQPVQYLQSRYPEGIPLVTIFIHSSMIKMLDTSGRMLLKAIAGLILSRSCLHPLNLKMHSSPTEESFLGNHVLSVKDLSRRELKAMLIFLIVMHNPLWLVILSLDIFTRVEKEMHTFQAPMKESKVLKDTSQLSEFNESVEVEVDNQDSVPEKTKKNQRKGKDASSLHISGSNAMKEEANVPSEEWKITNHVECGQLTSFARIFVIHNECILLVVGIVDPEVIVMPLAKHLRPMLLNVWSERRKTLFAENADRMKQLLDSLQKKFEEESFLSIQLYEKALDLFESDQSTSNVLHRHLLRTTSASIVDVLLLDLDIHNKLKNGIVVEDAENPESHSLSQGDRINLAKGLQGSSAVKAVAMVE
ncbi:E3 UFM1-protein ligase 1-like protein [Drosera capensis]